MDISRFHTPAHMVSWAKFAPIDKNSAGKKPARWFHRQGQSVVGRHSRRSRRRHLAHQDLPRRALPALARRRGKKRAIVAVGNSVLTIIWHLLANAEAHYQDLGPDYYQSKINARRRERELVRQLERLSGKRSLSNRRQPPNAVQPQHPATHLNPGRAVSGYTNLTVPDFIVESATGRSNM